MARSGSGPDFFRRVHWLGSADTDQATVGEEIACLSRLSRDHVVPPAFCLTAPVLEVLADGSLESDGAVISEAYRTLLASETDTGVDLRSCLVRPDLPVVTWVSQPWSFRNVVGAEGVIAGVTECLAPYASARARAYRQRYGADHAPPTLAILVARFVEPNISTLVWSYRSLSGTHAVLVTANWGIAESLADPAVSPDRYLVRRSDLALLASHVGDKRVMVVPEAGGVTAVPVPHRLRDRRCLEGFQVSAMAGISLDVERFMGGPVQVEMAQQDGVIHVLWCARDREHPAPSRHESPTPWLGWPCHQETASGDTARTVRTVRTRQPPETSAIRRESGTEITRRRPCAPAAALPWARRRAAWPPTPRPRPRPGGCARLRASSGS
jgi:pyruvate phosphate dikinase-like enzyme